MNLVKTDAVFPNNWFSTHRDPETLFVYPMYSPNRRLESREDPIVHPLDLSQQYGYQGRSTFCFLTSESKEQYSSKEQVV